MPIPKHNELRVPVLEYLRNRGASSSKEMVTPLSQTLNLTEEEVNQMYASGNGPIFKDRISWALTYLGLSGLINKLGRGVYEISQKGKEMLNTPVKIDSYIDSQMALREAQKNGIATNKEQIMTQGSTHKLTPQEELYESYSNIKKTVLNEILDTIISKSPREFERLVVALLQKMGYGGEVKDSGIVTQATNDQGIDGIIKEDILGFGRIHIQAKKYGHENGIGREDIQKFVGALAVAKSNKGVFITTSYYTKGALEYAKNLNGQTNIVLINGDELAEYIYHYDLGLQTEQIIYIKKLDNDYWDAMQDN
jgi:restriction system protein